MAKDREKNPEDHEASEIAKGSLRNWTNQQKSQPDPDQIQEDSANPTTEDVVRPPSNQPKTIDPETGKVHYSGERSELPGGTVQHEGE